MEGRLGRLHCRYNMIGKRTHAYAVREALDRLARERVAEEYAAALTQALGDVPTVYVVRHIDAPAMFVMEAGISDPRFVCRWGERLAGAVLRKLAEADDDRDNVMVFRDQAEYVVHFICDLLDGVAWNRWYYGAFRSLRSLSKIEALRRALLDNRTHLSAILGSLHRGQADHSRERGKTAGPLEKVLALLDERSIREIWKEGPAADPPATDDALRPIFGAALRLAGKLNWWRQPSRADEDLFQEYLAARPITPDWRDRRGLAAAVFDILLFWDTRGILRRRGETPDAAGEALLAHALSDLDWADVDWLQAALLTWMNESSATRSEPLPMGKHQDQTACDPRIVLTPELPARPAGRGVTPRQRELLADLAAALGDDALYLDFEHFDSEANALRLYAALVARAPRWADDPAATGMIGQLLTSWSFVRRSHAIDECLRRLREGVAAAAAGTLPITAREKATRAFQFIVTLADAARAVMDMFARRERDTAHAALSDEAVIDLASFAESGIDTDCAGTALLLRTVSDARLSTLVAEAGFSAMEPLTPLSAMLLALCLRWSGDRAAARPNLDAGLSLVAGLQSSPTIDQLRETWACATSVQCLRFQASLFELLLGQRFAQDATLRLYRVETPGGREALVVGDHTGLLWPFGRIIAGGDAVAPAVAELLQAWIDAAGGAPSVITADPLPAGWDARIAPPDRELLTVEAPDAIHAVGRRALLDALDRFDAGRMELPDVDLMIALSAAALLRMWARWLRQFADSSLPYLLTNFLDRRGRVSLTDEMVLVELDRRPMDIVLEMAGYIADLDRAPWLRGRTLRFRMRGE